MKPIGSSDKMQLIRSDIRGRVYEKSLEMIKQGIHITRLNTGNPATFGFGMPDSVRNALLNNADKAVAYCDPRGMDDARQAIIAYHESRGIQGLTEDDVYIGNGISELASMICTCILSAGDEMLIPLPYYSLWTNAVYLAMAKPVFYHCDEKNGWVPDVEDMEKKLTPKTKAVLLINPNNPTGQVYPPAAVQKVVDFARKHELLIISDEIYDRLIFDNAPFESTAKLAPDLPVITTNGLSKSHIICGFRCGWAVISGPRDLTAELNRNMFKLAAMRLCGNALTQLVIPAAMNDPESTIEMISPGGRLYEQRKAAIEELDKLQAEGLIEYNAPMAAFYLFPKVSDRIKVKDDIQLAFDLLESKHILIVNGTGFGWPDPDHFRMILLPEPDELRKSIRDIGDFLRDYSQE
ncbi:MAG: aminotransferase class I/II-fold pyridoxal phosphate-dependent enzyme [Solobacterium sp.]|nr:aminotransferase class I/II-fold pyridoxal phosphate-dependent enzyme [Solobacterium sp.]MBQ1355179.1 aminotransferase class I/II-fold pyridoxal phosphate-dependent enzyme [Solobacterium sp.]